jgi:mono/diheme cytochrome c family protein
MAEMSVERMLDSVRRMPPPPAAPSDGSEIAVLQRWVAAKWPEGPGCSGPSDVARSTAPAGDQDRGRATYLRFRCHDCHGTVGQGGEKGAGPKIAPNPVPYSLFVARVRAPSLAMPAYRHLSDLELAEIYAYLSAVKGPPALKDITLPDR